MGSIIKRIMRHFNGTDWDDYYPKTSSDQVVHTKSDGTATTVQSELAELNSKLFPYILYNGARTLKYTDAWNDIYGFNAFDFIEFEVEFLGTFTTLRFNNITGEGIDNNTLIHTFSFVSYPDSDNKVRIISGRLKFAGRWISDLKVMMSYDLQTFAELDASKIIVRRVTGWNSIP